MGTVVSNGLLFAVSLMAARWLGTADYGIVASMLSLMVILTIPSFALQVVVAREVAGRDEATAALVMRTRIRQAALFGAAATLLAWLAAPLLADGLRLPNAWPIIFTAAVAAPLLMMTVQRGVLQGRRSYGGLGISLAAEGGARFVAAALALVVGAGATGVTLAPLVGALVAGAIAWWSLRALPRPPRGARRVPLPATIWATGAYFAGFAALTNTDLLVVKNASEPRQAGEYAAAAFVGKVVLMLPVAITTVMIPEVAARRARGESTRPLLLQALALTGASCGALVVACAVAPELVAALTYGDGYDGALDLLLPYAVAMLLFALASVQMLYGLTLGANLAAWACLTAAVSQAGVMWALRNDPGPIPWTDDPHLGVISVMITTGALLWALAAAALRAPRATVG